jgi:SAM-dependent methyltransferase
MQYYLYHWAPKNMYGTILYPLNVLKTTQPSLYDAAVKKYEGREKLLQDVIPYLDCLWNDVIHLSPVHPSQITQAYRELGQDRGLRSYQIDAGSLDASKAVIYWYKYLDFRDKHKPDNYDRFSVDKLSGTTTLPQVTKEYYRSMFKRGERPLPFVGVPHVLYQGSINISGLEIVGETLSAEGHSKPSRLPGTVLGAQPKAIMIEARPLMGDGPVLDLGVGTGRNTLYLARQGLAVTAVDIAPIVIKDLTSAATIEGMQDRVTGIIADIGDFKPDNTYSTVICTFALHFLDKTGFEKAFGAMFAATSPGGINVVEDFTRDGPLYRTGGTTYWLKQGELRERYTKTGWNVVSYKERPVKTKAIDDNGRPFDHMAAAIIARKPSE